MNAGETSAVYYVVAFVSASIQNSIFTVANVSNVLGLDSQGNCAGSVPVKTELSAEGSPAVLNVEAQCTSQGFFTMSVVTLSSITGLGPGKDSGAGNNKPSNKSHSGLYIGIGVAVAILVFIAIVGYVWTQKKRQ